MATRKLIVAFLLIWLFYQSAEAALHFYHNISVFLVLMAGCIGVSWLVARWLWNENLQTYGLPLKGGLIWQLPIGFLLAILVRGLFVLSRFYNGQLEIAMPVSAWQVVAVMPLILLGTLLPSLAEDILTRAFVFRSAQWPPIIFILISALLYVLNHTYRLVDGPEVWLFLFTMGVVLAWPLATTRTLWFTLGLHWGMNVFYRVGEDVVHLQTGDNSFIELTGFTLLLLPLSYLILRVLPQRG